MHKPESVLENETYKILWYFEVKMTPLISARRPDLVIVNKKKKQKKRERERENLPNSGLGRLGRRQGKIEGKRKKR